MVTLLVDLGLFGTDERALVNIGVYLNVGVIAELQGILEAGLLALLLVLVRNASDSNLPICCSQQALRWFL